MLLFFDFVQRLSGVVQVKYASCEAPLPYSLQAVGTASNCKDPNSDVLCTEPPTGPSSCPIELRASPDDTTAIAGKRDGAELVTLRGTIVAL